MPVSDFECVPTYGIVQLVYTTWDEVYVYADGELVDTADIGGRDSESLLSLFEEYLLGAKVSRIYDLAEDLDDDVLPDEIVDSRADSASMRFRRAFSASSSRGRLISEVPIFPVLALPAIECRLRDAVDGADVPGAHVASRGLGQDVDDLCLGEPGCLHCFSVSFVSRRP